MLEQDFGWRGLLVEGDPRNYRKLLAKHRNAWSVNLCLSTEKFPIKVTVHELNNDNP